MFVRSKFFITRFSVISLTFCSLVLTGQLMAQEPDEGEDEGYGASSSLLEEVTVTARKREENAQEVPIAISAYTGEQLEALKIRDLRGLSVAMPNVAMDDIGTFRGVANFSIRGLGINSSIPGIDPTVGVFIDGVYLTQNAGVVLDMFDIESIEVLRGPQGTLFGRNVTGGAVLVNTKKPTDEFELSLRGAVDGNPNGDGGTNYYLMGAVGGAITDSFAARLSVYHNEDDGWFENLATGETFGESSTTIYRPSFIWEPSNDLRLTLRWEHFETDGQGPASQNHPNGRGVPGAFVQPFYPFAFERDSSSLPLMSLVSLTQKLTLSISGWTGMWVPDWLQTSSAIEICTRQVIPTSIPSQSGFSMRDSSSTRTNGQMSFATTFRTVMAPTSPWVFTISTAQCAIRRDGTCWGWQRPEHPLKVSRQPHSMGAEH